MYSLDQLRRGLSNPSLIGREINRLYYTRLRTRAYNTSGFDIVAEDWDNLVLMDACRYDLFNKVAKLPGTLSPRTSRGANTREFLLGNFQNRTLHDMVYITASPMLHRNRETINVEFHAEVNVWVDGWDDEYRTVLPETMVKQTLEAVNKYSDKRLLIHFIQPHYPFLDTDEQPFKSEQAFDAPDDPDCWDQVLRGEIRVQRNTIWRAYEATLKRGLSAARELLNTLDGKTVVTSDHGNMIGERSRPVPVHEWGHPYGIYTPELVTVPWYEHPTSTRRDITPERPKQSNSAVPESEVISRLESLGYAEP